MAGLQINVKTDFRGIDAQLRQLKDGTIRSAAARALNRASTTARKEAVAELKGRFGLKTRSLTKRIKRRTATRASLQSILEAFDYDPPLSTLSPRWRRFPRTPVGASVKFPGGGRVTVPGAFVAPTKYGRDAVFRRTGQARTPLKFLRASDIGVPTLVKAFLEQPIVRVMTDTGQREFARVFEREIRLRTTGV
jgi:hypothetical protein